VDQVDAGWCVREFAGLDLGDARLNRRLLTMAEAFGAQPQASINQASEGWQATKAAYAFFANPRVEPSDILLPHQQRTLERMAAEELVLAVQDTCFLTYTHQAVAWVEEQFGVSYTESGMVKLLKRLDYRFKQPDILPAKADPEKQAKWVETYREKRGA
jgi:transposase